MSFRNVIAYTTSCILKEGAVTVSQDKISFSDALKEGDLVSPYSYISPLRYELPIVEKKIDNNNPCFGIVQSEPRLLKIPDNSVSDWDIIFKNEWYRIAVVEFYNM